MIIPHIQKIPPQSVKLQLDMSILKNYSLEPEMSVWTKMRNVYLQSWTHVPLTSNPPSNRTPRFCSPLDSGNRRTLHMESSTGCRAGLWIKVHCPLLGHCPFVPQDTLVHYSFMDFLWVKSRHEGEESPRTEYLRPFYSSVRRVFSLSLYEAYWFVHCKAVLGIPWLHTGFWHGNLSHFHISKNFSPLWDQQISL